MMIFLTVATELLLSFFFTGGIPGVRAQGFMNNKVSDKDIATALFQAVEEIPSFALLFDPTLSPEVFYNSALKEFKDLGVLNFRELAKKVKIVTEATFPRLNSYEMKKAVIGNIAIFLAMQGFQGDLDKLVESYVHFLQKAVKDSAGNRELLAKKGFGYTIDFLKSTGLINADNAGELYEPMFDSFYIYAYCKN